MYQYILQLADNKINNQGAINLIKHRWPKLSTLSLSTHMHEYR